MKNRNALENQTTRRFRLIASAAALAVTLTGSVPQLARAAADEITPPPTPAKIHVPPGNTAFLAGHAVGTQDYVCLPSGPGFAWALFTPQATLFSDKQVITHFFSPNPFENGAVRATWKHSQDTSTIWGKVKQSSSDPDFVAPGAVPWLLLQIERVGAQDGPTGGHTLTETTYVQRVNTAGGSAPATGCSQLADVGARAFVPYTADYLFFSDDGS